MAWCCLRDAGRQRGLALVMVLWTVVLLALIAAAFLAESRSGAVAVRNELDAARVEALADAGVAWAVRKLTETNPEERWTADGRTYEWEFQGHPVEITIQDEAGKIDLNHAPRELLRGLFLSVGVDQGRAGRLADAVIDFRDADDLRRAQGAEDDDYRQASLPLGAKDAPFDLVSELRHVIGITRELYRQVEPVLTVYSEHNGIDPAFAPAAALAALPGMGETEIQRVLDVRQRPETREQAIRDLMYFQNVRPLISLSKGRTHTIRARASGKSGGTFVRQAVVYLAPTDEDDPYTVLSLRQGRSWAGTASMR